MHNVLSDALLRNSHFLAWPSPHSWLRHLVEVRYWSCMVRIRKAHWSWFEPITLPHKSKDAWRLNTMQVESCQSTNNTHSRACVSVMGGGFSNNDGTFNCITLLSFLRHCLHGSDTKRLFHNLRETVLVKPCYLYVPTRSCIYWPLHVLPSGCRVNPTGQLQRTPVAVSLHVLSQPPLFTAQVSVGWRNRVGKRERGKGGVNMWHPRFGSSMRKKQEGDVDRDKASCGWKIHKQLNS